MPDVPKKLAQYRILERIALRGTTEVYKAVAQGVGFEKVVAIKRLLPHIAGDDEFIMRFKDEARLTAQLQHSNIAQVFELRSEGEAFYMVLEYVAGKDLREIFEHARSIRRPMPLPHVCFVIMAVCEGLEYAHNKRDRRGHPLGLVHRDVSPPNVLVSFEGEVKLTGFGAAKVAGRASQTQPGILHGKFGYMSPEQVRGNTIDRRSDVFSLGTVLWEILCNQRLFKGETDFATLEKVRTVNIDPPSRINPAVPSKLEQIVMRALAADRDHRYQTAAELHDALQAFMFLEGLFCSRKNLAEWMQDHFAKDIELEREKAQQILASRPDPPPPPPSDLQARKVMVMANSSPTPPPPPEGHRSSVPIQPHQTSQASAHSGPPQPDSVRAASSKAHEAVSRPQIPIANTIGEPPRPSKSPLAQVAGSKRMSQGTSMLRKYTIFVSSTQRDLLDERNRVVEAILRASHIPVAMEYFPATASSSWDLITRLVDDCDYVVCIIAARYGFVPPGEEKSYTEKEYDYALATGKPVISFLHGAVETLPAEHHESTEYGRARLREFRAKITNGKNVIFWRSITDLVGALASSLHDLFKQHPKPGWIRATEIEELQEENSRLNIAARARENLPGAIDRAPKNPRQMEILVQAYALFKESESAWMLPESVDKDVEWLTHHGYLDRDAKRHGYKLSLDGWDYMEELERQEPHN